ncbi:BTAD domain-containing putative transcriptional regulator [Amycolatopsis sp. NPDC005232]|uniref:AfsR/SARP family transcriptional regulator n=1 Tax=Amycolatopsis sp. NPDC005232 TaxID=3157027 RepID=UPI0033A22921
MGDVEVFRDGAPHPVGSTGPRSALVALVLDSGHPVSIEELIARVWGQSAPNSARSTLHSYFSRLRGALAGEYQIVRRGTAYVLDVPPEQVDVHRFRQLANRARQSQRPDETLPLIDEGLGLWHGEPLSGMESPWLAATRTTLCAERNEMLLDRTDLHLQLGHHAQILPELSVRAGAHPFDERLAGQLMLALHGCGRQADALVHFQTTKAQLVEELGVDPGAQLRAVYEAVLRDEPATKRNTSLQVARASAEPPGETTLPTPVPRQLPAAPRSFTSRKLELSALSTSLAPVSVIVGPGGVGKTSLALHWGQAQAERFPDGQLFIDLRGFDPAVDRMKPDAALQAFITALGTPAAAIPEDPATMSGLFRSVTADRRLLIVLDNALDVDQVTPLLPGHPGCAVVITSRNRLTRLVTGHDAQLISLDVLDEADSYDLLVNRLGEPRAAAEPAAVARLVDACAGLPLALSIVIGRAHEHPDFSLTSLADELVDATSTLNALEVDPDLGIRAVFTPSVAALPEEPAMLLRLLSLVPGPHIALDAAASLSGKTYAATRATLRALECASLVQQHQPGRYRLHDLVRAFAQEQAQDRMDEPSRTAALERIIGYYLHTLISAIGFTDPGPPPITPPPLPAGCAPVSLRDADGARRWFAAEADTIAAVQAKAEELGRHEAVWQLAWGMSTFFSVRGELHDLVHTWEKALAAAENLGDTAARILSRRQLAMAMTRLGHHARALEYVTEAIEIAQQTNHDIEQSLNWMCKFEIELRQGLSEEALKTISTAWSVASGQPAAIRIRIGNSFAFTLTQLGRYGEAREKLEASCLLMEDANAHLMTASMLDTLAHICLGEGRLEEAVGHLEEAAVLMTTEPFALADTLVTLGKTYRELNRHDDAVRNLGRAVDMFRRQHREFECGEAQAVLDKATLEFRAVSPRC